MERDPGLSVAELLFHYRELVQNGGSLLEGYWHIPHNAWNKLTPKEQRNFITSIPNSLAALFIHMMFGEPAHSTQPQNRLTFPIFELLFANKLQVLVEPDEDSFPRWLGILKRFNTYEDGSTSKALDMIKSSLYPDPYDLMTFRHHQRLLRSMTELRL